MRAATKTLDRLWVLQDKGFLLTVYITELRKLGNRHQIDLAVKRVILEQIIKDQDKLGQVSKYQSRLGQIRKGHSRLGQINKDQNRLGQISKY
jgi:hypothetical protein